MEAHTYGKSRASEKRGREVLDGEGEELALVWKELICKYDETPPLSPQSSEVPRPWFGSVVADRLAP